MEYRAHFILSRMGRRWSLRCSMARFSIHGSDVHPVTLRFKDRKVEGMCEDSGESQLNIPTHQSAFVSGWWTSMAFSRISRDGFLEVFQFGQSPQSYSATSRCWNRPSWCSSASHRLCLYSVQIIGHRQLDGSHLIAGKCCRRPTCYVWIAVARITLVFPQLSWTVTVWALYDQVIAREVHYDMAPKIYRTLFTDICMFFAITLIASMTPSMDFIISACCYWARLAIAMHNTFFTFKISDSGPIGARLTCFLLFVGIFLFCTMYATELERRYGFVYTESYLKTAERQQLLVQYS